MRRKGFSLIEVMVGIAIIITATTVVLSIIVSSFRISSKTTTADTLRQNGNYAISQLTRTIQFAETFPGVSHDGTNFSDSCDDADENFRYLRVNYRDEEKTLSCSSSGLTINGASIIDSNTRVVTCEIKCYRDQDSSPAPIIDIKFNLRRGTSGTGGDQSAGINFDTKIKMRNI